jgi:hypothetical protein
LQKEAEREAADLIEKRSTKYLIEITLSKETIGI